MRKIVPLLAFLVTAFSAVFGVSSAYALDTPNNSSLDRSSCGFDVCQNQGPVFWGDWGSGEAFRYEFSEGLKLSLYLQAQSWYGGNPSFTITDGSGNVKASNGSFYKAYYNYGRGGAYVAHDFGGWWVDIVVRFEENYYWDNWENVFYLRYLAKKDGSQVLQVPKEAFLSLRNWAVKQVLYNGSTSNLDYYGLVGDDTIGYSFVYESDQSVPAVFSPPSSVPLFSSVSTFSPGTVQPAFQYSGNDGWTYVLLPYSSGGPKSLRLDTGENSGNSFWDSVKDFFGVTDSGHAFASLAWKVPVWVLEPADDRLVTVFQSWYTDPSWMGPGHSWANGGIDTVTGALQTVGLTLDGVFPGERSAFLGLSGYANPKLYFLRQNGTYAVWDMNCATVGYDSCVQSSPGSWKCADSLGNLSPNGETCGIPIDAQPYVPGGSSSGSGSTGSGSSSGSGSSGSGSSGSGSVSYPSYPTVDQNCVPKLFSGSLVSVTTAANLDPSTCAWRTANGAFRCQDSGSHACVVDSDSCLPEIEDPGQYSSGSTQYSGDVTRYECYAGQTQCLWYSKKSCGPSASCYQDGAYCRVKPDEENPDFSAALGPVAFSGTPSPDPAYDVSNLGALGTGSVTVSGVSDGVGSFSGVAPLTALTESGFCDMFNSDGSFAYYSNGEAFAVTLSVTWIVPIDWVEENVVPHVDRFFAVFTAPVNNLGAILRTFGTFPEGAKVCVLGRVAEIRYQSSLKSLDSAKHVAGFQPGRMGFFDYVFLLVFGVIVVAWLRKAVSNPS